MKNDKHVIDLPGLVKNMEEALLRGQMERFQGLSKQRSRTLHALCAKRQNMKNGKTAETESDESLSYIDGLLKQAIDDNNKLIESARQAASATQQKITELAKKKKSTVRLAHSYGHSWLKVFSSGNMMSVKG